jgi:hypothetical protein
VASARVKFTAEFAAVASGANPNPDKENGNFSSRGFVPNLSRPCVERHASVADIWRIQQEQISIDS